MNSSSNLQHGNSHAGALDSGIFFKAFLGLLLRDLRVLTREFLPFLLRVGMQPLLFLFVFTFILPRMGGGNPLAAGGGKTDFGTIILPGLMAVAIMFSGIAAVALPLSSEFGITREIDDRVMCPLPLWAVALEKVCFSAMQSIIAALLVIPMAIYIPAVPVRADISNWFLLALVLVLASLLAGSLGLVIGSTVNPRQLGLVDYVFGLRVLPLGLARQDQVAQDSGAFQPDCLYERGASRRRHAQHRAHAMVGHSDRAGILPGRTGPLGAQGIPGPRSVLGPAHSAQAVGLPRIDQAAETTGFSRLLPGDWVTLEAGTHFTS